MLRWRTRTGQERSPIDEVVLAAPDYDADEFRAVVGELKGKARRYTLYGSEKDLALVASKNMRKDHPRAGDGGANLVVVAGVETIDATSVGQDLLGLGHSYFASQRTLLSDINYVIKESLPPGVGTVLLRSNSPDCHIGCLCRSSLDDRNGASGFAGRAPFAMLTEPAGLGLR